eukprot:TRINITY_DN38847_c0_g2_i1.p1 TRINITY_DN38847_c0_g2~~TRINITY_DN38847_c0_g2_i1.p1  ORF type:complete len:422 (+),score=62.27 TRINITY_DN38847_c0_g2_i1:141-1406(+)
MGSRTEDPLVLKVMRLRRPLVEAPNPLAHGIGTAAAGGFCSDAPKLRLPMSLTQSFVGEPFSGYLHLANRSDDPITDVSLRVEMQVGSSRVALFDNSTRPLAVVKPGEFFDVGVEHELQDAGTYVLSCTVSHAPKQGTDLPRGLFKRSYRFPALQPFAVAHRVAQLGPRLLVECQVENATSGNLLLTSWNLECADGLEALPLAAPAVGDVDVDGFATPTEATPTSGTVVSSRRSTGKRGNGSPQLLRPRGSHSIVFTVSPVAKGSHGSSSTADAVRRLRELDLVGHLALNWHVPDGPSGCVEGHQVRLQPLSTPNLEIRVVMRPHRVVCEEPFRMEAEVTNRMQQVAEPTVIFEQRLLGALRVHGPTRRSVGRIDPLGSAIVVLEFSASVPGLHSLRGLLLLDELTQSKVEFGSLCEVLAF